MTTCVFCDIVTGNAPATITREWGDAIAFTPLNPVNPGHTLVIPRVHVDSAVTDPDVTAATMRRAAQLAKESEHSNILTSIGRPATQSIFHLHIHVVPRRAGDWLMLPWGTAGDPHKPHWCKVAQSLQDQLDKAATA
ncbi:HIT family protein [Streptomonospora halophila]|uniref:HIT family protein n=1 Tax=Streptomonospora halophila TaxID=427369 RepID=A0ABP9G5T2_9ACTN